MSALIDYLNKFLSEPLFTFKGRSDFVEHPESLFVLKDI